MNDHQYLSDRPSVNIRRQEIHENIWNEQIRQDTKWGEQNHNPYIYLGIVLEELGELAEAVLQTQFGGLKGGWKNVRKEALHVAATAASLIECLDRNQWRPNDVTFDNPFGDK